MSLDDEYFIVLAEDSELYPTLVPTAKSKNMRIQFNELPKFGEPIFFEADEKDEIEDIEELEFHPLFVSKSSLVVVKNIKDFLQEFIIPPGMHFYPAVYVDENEKWHEDFWYLNIYSEIDCWDRDKSRFKTFSRESGDVHDLREISLSAEVLGKIPESERLIFRMGGTARSQLFIHQKVVNYFEEAQISGCRSIRVSDYDFSMEF